MSDILLVVIIIKTARSPIQVWKGSPLALLFMDVDPSIRGRTEGVLSDYNDITEQVGRNSVILGADARRNLHLKAV